MKNNDLEQNIKEAKESYLKGYIVEKHIGSGYYTQVKSLKEINKKNGWYKIKNKINESENIQKFFKMKREDRERFHNTIEKITLLAFDLSTHLQYQHEDDYDDIINIWYKDNKFPKSKIVEEYAKEIANRKKNDRQ